MKVVVIGCTQAGIAAIRQILKDYPQSQVTVYERQNSISYLSCATYLHIEGTVKTLSDAMYAEPEDFVRQGVNLKLKHDVIQIDHQKHSLVIQDLITREMETATYDKLIVTTGSLTAIPTISGVESPKVLLCKTYDQARDLCANTIDEHRIAVIGGGYVGVELAESYIKSGHEVWLIHNQPNLLEKYVEPIIAKTVEATLIKKGVHLITGAHANEFVDTKDDGLLIKTSQGDSYQVDMAVVSAGIIPQTDLLRGQVKMQANGAIIVDPYMHTSDPDILAAGDDAVVHFNPTDSCRYSPLASHAVRQGMLAGINVFERKVRSIGTQATTGIQIFDQTVATTGLTLKDAKTTTYNARSVVYEGPYRPEFMPDAFKVTVVLIYDHNSRKILGAQLISQHDVAQSANIVSSLIQNGGTIDQLALLDMLFSPNFNNPFDYLNLAAQKAVAQEKGFLNS
ncbi:NADH oxidase [Companilactobacillus zhachilii]|uniref:NADH oxidase n=1 Tax=Companilactobacillus zhachilii TaxID=2304606 RepID=A0A386PQX2_9LACO|nr:FAD-dependent oxidoreductase [Companilactobacillus zhachilii]AYE38351.1 NADH oxidase [Companilactobacillus zhachilii]